MKKILKVFVVTLLSLAIVSQFTPAINVSGGYKGFLVTTFALTLAHYLIKPLIKLLILPINLITLGGFRWLTNVVTIYIVSLVVDYFQIVGFHFNGFTYNGLVIPSFFVSQLVALILVSFLMSITATFFFWLFK